VAKPSTRRASAFVEPVFADQQARGSVNSCSAEKENVKRGVGALCLTP